MCRRHYRGVYGSPTCFRKRGQRNAHGCYHRRCIEITIMQNRLASIKSQPATFSVNHGPTPRNVSPVIPENRLQVLDDPPPYCEVEGTDYIGTPESTGRAGHNDLDKPVPLEHLGQKSAYTMVPAFLSYSGANWSVHNAIINPTQPRAVFPEAVVYLCQLQRSAIALVSLPRCRHYISQNMETKYIIVEYVEANLRNGNLRIGVFKWYAETCQLAKMHTNIHLWSTK